MARPGTAHPARHSATRSIMKIALLQWRIVSAASIDRQWRQSRRRADLYPHFTPLAISLQVGGPVADHVLIPQFVGYFFRDVAQLVDIVHAKHSAPGRGANVIEQFRSHALFWRRRIWIENPHGENLHVRLPHQRFHLSLGVARAVISPV